MTPPSKRLDRRALLLGTGAALGASVLGLPLAWAQGEDPERRKQRREAIRRGCEFIKSKQHSNQGGGFGDDNGIVAITALSVLALMSEGSTDGRGRYGKQVREGLDFLLKLVETPLSAGRHPEGYFYHPQDASSKMHGQGYATLALASALGTSTQRRDQRIRKVVVKAVQCIEQAQTKTGGYGYEPQAAGTEHEGSVTVTVAQALRAAHDAGIPINQNVIRRGLYYLKRSQNEDGSFRYSTHTNTSSYALTAAALSSFFLFGKYADDKDRTIERGLAYMMKMARTEIRTSMRWYYYGNFYAAWTCWQKDGSDWQSPSGTWSRWHRMMYPHILDQQSLSGGNWDNSGNKFDFGPLVPTSFAVLTLAIPDEVLPIMQR